MNTKAVFIIITLSTFITPSLLANDVCDYASIKGEEIIFRQMFAGGEKYGYQLWYSKLNTETQHLPYEPYVGKKGKVQDGIISGKYNHSNFKQVILENCESVYAKLLDNDLPDDVIRSLDVNTAKLLIGKNIWINQTSGSYPFDLITLDEETNYTLKNAEKVLVVDLYMPSIGHSRGSQPFFLKVRKSSGQEGFFPFNTLYFHLSNPIPAGTPKKIAQSIHEQKITLGMTAKQVELSWGKPENINRSVGSWGIHEQWIYNHQYVYLKNGKVSSFQD